MGTNGVAVVRTLPGREKFATENLRQFGYAPYLPMCREETSSRLIPLFPSFIFIQDWHEAFWRRVSATKGVSNILGLMRDSELEKIKAREEEFGYVLLTAPKPTTKFTKGQKVRAKIGVWSGIEGCFVKSTGRERCIALLGSLQIPVTMRASELEPAA